MGKRSDFERKPKDFYETPVKAVEPLIPHLKGCYHYIDPCAGNGAIERAIFSLTKGSMYQVCAFDLFNADYKYESTLADARTHKYPFVFDDAIFITNPPWSRPVLHAIIENLASQKPAWLLFDADWMHTKQAAPYLKYCKKIISIGRVSWMGNGVSGMDNCCWYLFDKKFQGLPQLIGRAA